MHRSHFLRKSVHFLLIGVLWTCIANVSAQQQRYWYDNTYRFRTDAAIVLANEKSVDLQKHDNDVVTVALSDLSEADQEYLSAYRLSVQAVKYLDESPYVDGDRELEDLRQKLVDKKVWGEHARDITQSYKHTNDLRHRDLVGRWVDINSTAYKVVRVYPSGRVNGIEDIVVQVDDYTHLSIPFDKITSVRILPQIKWHRARMPASEAFHHRSPRIRSSLSSEHRWKYELVYDRVESVWTDPSTVEANRLLADAEQLWDSTDEWEHYAAARWHVNQGNVFVSLEQYDNALAHFSAAIRRKPDHADAFLQRGNLDRALNDNTSALADLDKAVEFSLQESRFDNYERDIALASLYSRSEVRSEELMHEDAIADAEHAIRLSPHGEGAKYRNLLFSVRRSAADDMERQSRIVVDEYESGKDPDEKAWLEAIAQARKAVSYNPDPDNGRYKATLFDCEFSYATYLSEHSQLALERRDYEQGIRFAEKARDANPDPNEKIFEQRHAEAHREAVEWFTKIADDALSRGAFDDAVAASETAHFYATDDLKAGTQVLVGRCHLSRGNSFLDRGLYKEAATDLSVTIESGFRDPLVYFNRARAYLGVSQDDAAVTDLTAAIALAPKFENAYALRGYVYKWQAKQDAAFSDFLVCEGLNPSASEYPYELAVLSFTEKDYQEARIKIDRAISLNADLVQYHLLSAEIYLAENDFERAKSAIEIARALAPESPDVARLARRIEYRDPMYFDRAEIGPAAGMILVAWGAGVIEKDLKEAAEEEDDLFAKGFGRGLAYLAGRGKEAAIDNAITRVLPNFREPGKGVVHTIISQFVAAVVYKDTSELKAIPKEIVVNFGKERFSNWLEQNHPEWTFSVELAEFAHAIYSGQ